METDFNLRKKLLTVADAKKLNIKATHKLYKNYISKSQVSFFKKFSFGNDLAIKAEGSFIFFKKKKVLDLSGGIGVLNHGHNHKKIISQRILFQKEKKMEVHKLFFSQYLAALSYNIAQILPGDLNRSFFPNSGAEAIEGAIKLAYKYYNGKRKYILHSDISFHGKTIGAANISGSKEINFQYQKMLGVDKYKFNDFESLKKKVFDLKKKNQLCYAIVIEPLSASTLRSNSVEFLEKARKLCDKEKIVLIYDEIYTGWCKTGLLFNFLRSKTIPDILVYAKSFGGGKASISGYTVRESFMKTAYDNSEDFSLQSSTYNGFGEEAITAIESLNIIFKENYILKSKKIGMKLETMLNTIIKKYPSFFIEHRGMGCFQGILIKNPFNENLQKIISKLLPLKILKNQNFFKKLLCASIINFMYEKHNILLFGSFASDVVLKISPNIDLDLKLLDKFFQSFDDTLSKGINYLVLNFIKNNLFK